MSQIKCTRIKLSACAASPRRAFFRESCGLFAFHALYTSARTEARSIWDALLMQVTNATRRMRLQHVTNACKTVTLEVFQIILTVLLVGGGQETSRFSRISMTGQAAFGRKFLRAHCRACFVMHAARRYCTEFFGDAFLITSWFSSLLYMTEIIWVANLP